MVRRRPFTPAAAFVLLASALVSTRVLFVTSPLGANRRLSTSVPRKAGSDLKPAGAATGTKDSAQPIWLSALLAVAAGVATVVGAAAGLVGALSNKKPVPKWDPASEVGVTEPLGYFDPLGLCTDQAAFRQFRAQEIKHGRVAMMAAVGAVVQHYVKLPGFQSVPSGLKALTTYPGNVSFGIIFLLAGFLELRFWTEDPDKEPGNFGDPAGWSETGLGVSGSYSEEMRSKEINNGRMAMLAAIGIVFADLATGKDGVQQLGFR